MREEQRKQLRQKWMGWLEEIGNELGWLLTGQDFFWRLQQIVQSNPKIQSPAILHNWIADNFVSKVSTSIVRLTDRYEGTISLYNLIKGIQKNPDVITRDYFVSKWHDGVTKEMGIASKTFDEFATVGEQCIDPEMLSSDIKILVEETEIIKIFRNKWVAHFDEEREIERMPTFKDVDDALNIIDRVWCKYSLLLTCSAPDTRKPSMALDWEAPLRHPWIDTTSIH